MKISPDIISKLHEIDCESLAKTLGLSVKGHRASCFMHVDRNPSLSFKGNYWKCFSCDKGGDAIAFIQERFSLSFSEACVYLCQHYNIPINTSSNNVRKKAFITQPNKTFFPAADTVVGFDSEIAQAIIDWTDLEPKGELFLFKQRMLSPEIVKCLNIKSISSSKVLQEKLETSFGKERLINSKILDEKTGKLTINIPSLIIPYYDSNYKIVALQTRYLGTSEYVPRFKLLCNSKAKTYNVPVLADIPIGSKLFIAEGITDCLSLLSLGKNAVAIQSATCISLKDLEKMSKYELYMIPDRDIAGDKAFVKLYRYFLRCEKILKRIDLPDEYKDFSEYYLALKKDENK